MVVLGSALGLLVLADDGVSLIGVAVLMGAAQALVFPSTLALVSLQVNEKHLGAGMGLVGTLRNGGKVVGPVLAGTLIHWLDHGVTFRLMGLALLIGALVLWQGGRLAHRPRRQRRRALA